MKNKKLKKNAIMFFLIFIIIIVSITVICLINNKDGDNKIIATKTITDNEQTQIIKYTIKIKDYNIQSIIKEITFETEEEAKSEYNKYEIINEYEKREIGLELKKKKLILTMPEQQLKLDVGYEEYKNIRLISETGEEKEIVNEDELRECLIEQGYKIK